MDGGVIDAGREVDVPVSHVDGSTGGIAVGAGNNQGCAHAEAASIVHIDGLTGCVEAISFFVCIFIVGRTVRVQAGVFRKLLMLGVIPQFFLVGLCFLGAAGGIVCFHRNVPCGGKVYAGNGRIRLVGQAVVDEGTGKGPVGAAIGLVAANGNPGRNGPRNLFGGQKAFHLGSVHIGIGTAFNAGVDIIVDIGNGNAAAHGLAAAFGKVGIDAAGNLEVAFVGCDIEVCLVRSRPGDSIVFCQCGDILVDEVHRNGSAAGEISAGILDDRQAQSSCCGSTAAKGLNIHRFDPCQGTVLNGGRQVVINPVDSSRTADGDFFLGAVALAQGEGCTAAPGPDESGIPGTHLDVAVVVELEVSPVDQGFGGIRFQVDGNAAGSGKAEGRLLAAAGTCLAGRRRARKGRGFRRRGRAFAFCAARSSGCTSLVFTGAFQGIRQVFADPRNTV